MSVNPSQALAEVERQRVELADKVRLPVWYLAVYGLGWAGTFAGPTVMTGYHQVVLGALCQAFGAFVMGSLAVALRWTRGVRLPTNSFGAYPSMRLPLFGTFGVMLLGLAAGLALGLTGQPVPALLSALAVGLLAALLLHRMMAGIADDIRNDRVIFS